MSVISGQVTKGEVLALQVAKDAGVRAAEASLVDSGGLPVAQLSDDSTGMGG